MYRSEPIQVSEGRNGQQIVRTQTFAHGDTRVEIGKGNQQPLSQLNQVQSTQQQSQQSSQQLT